MRSLLPFFLLIILTGLSSCRKERDEEVTGKPFLMKIQVTGNYFHPQLGGIIFISDSQGRVMADARCQGDGTYSFYGAEGGVSPASVSVTIVRIEPYWHSYNIDLETYTCIRPAQWTLQGSRADTAGRYNPVFLNIAPLNGPILVSASGYSNLTFTPWQFPVTLYRNPDDLYIGIPTNNGMKYKWFEGIRAGSADTLDLSGALNTDVLPVKLAEQPVAYYECRVYGYSEENYVTPVPHLINELLGSDNPSGNIFIEFPPGKFTGYHTQIMIVDSWSSGVEFEYHTNGPIPAGFVRTSAAMKPPVPDGNQLHVKPSGSFDLLSGTWKYQSPYLGMVEWTVFGPDSSSLLQIPEISKELSATFPWLDRDSLLLSHAELTDFTDFQGYPAVPGTIYNPVAPSRFERHEFSRARFFPATKVKEKLP